jgi:hypothetical protein
MAKKSKSLKKGKKLAKTKTLTGKTGSSFFKSIGKQ